MENLNIDVVNPPDRLGIVWVAAEAFAWSSVTLVDKGHELRETKLRGFSILYWEMGPEFHGGGWRAIRIHDSNRKIVFKGYVHEETNRCAVDVCRRGSWRDEFVGAPIMVLS